MKKKNIAPDFFIYEIPRKDFLEILNSRDYMLFTKFKIPENRKYMSIVGEIKSSKFSAHRNTRQRRDYLKFVELANKIPGNEEWIILLYIYDESIIYSKTNKKIQLKMINL